MAKFVQKITDGHVERYQEDFFVFKSDSDTVTNGRSKELEKDYSVSIYYLLKMYSWSTCILSRLLLNCDPGRALYPLVTRSDIYWMISNKELLFLQERERDEEWKENAVYRTTCKVRIWVILTWIKCDPFQIFVLTIFFEPVQLFYVPWRKGHWLSDNTSGEMPVRDGRERSYQCPV